MSEDLIAQYRAKIERLQASNDEYRRQVDTLTAQMNEQGVQFAVAQADRDKYERDAIYHRVKVEELKEQLAAQDGELLTARKHASELREGFCVYACPDEGHLATCVNASKWLK
jgi:chromosome segregation ATPase